MHGLIRAEGTLEEIKRFLEKLPNQLRFKYYVHVTDFFEQNLPDPVLLTCYFGEKPEMLCLHVSDAGKVEIPMANLIQIEAKEGVTVFAGDTVDIFSKPKIKKEPKRGSTCKQRMVSINPKFDTKSVR